MIRNHFAGIYSGMLPDARLEKRVEKTMLALYNAGSAVTNKSCKTLAEKEGAYRMLDNDRFDHKDLTEGAIRRLRKNVKGAITLIFMILRNVILPLTWAGLAGRIRISAL
jgi:hypothetical protein